jgi:hypothetical protein
VADTANEAQEHVAVAERPSDRDKERAWKREQFERLGFGPELSEAMTDQGVDWHRAEQLLAKGCPHHLALKSLW